MRLIVALLIATCVAASTAKAETRLPLAPIVASTSPTSKPQSAAKQKIVLPLTNGAYYVTVHINGVPIQMIFDTGAPHVSMSRTMAANLGRTFTDDAFTFRMGTANGLTMVVYTILPELRIGHLTLKNVSATIFEDSSMPQSINLLGMSAIEQLDYRPVKGALVINSLIDE